MVSTTVLFQDDVFRYILDLLAPPNASPHRFRLSRPTLVSLARTCRAFLEPALDRLWSRLDSLEPLIQCFTSVLNDDTAGTPPSLSQWAIIQRYAHRVRELRINPLSRFSVAFLRSISVSGHSTLLVPNLRVLRWCSSDSTRTCPFLSVRFIRQVLSPCLVSLDVSLSDVDAVALRSFLATCPSVCPNLRSLVVNIAGRQRSSSTTIETLSRTVPLYEDLECLDASVPLDDVALTHVITSSAFKRLSLVLSNVNQLCILPGITPFRNVQELSLDVRDLNVVTPFLRTHDQCFHAIALRYRFPPTLSTVSAFLTALVSSPRARSLRSVKLTPVLSNHDHTDDTNGTTPPIGRSNCEHITYDTLHPLTSLSHLHELIVDLGLWYAINDDDLIRLARSWPALRVLRLNRRHRLLRHRCILVKYVTLRGLASLVECCPDLLDFCVPLDALEILGGTRKRIGNATLRYLLSQYNPRVLLACWEKPKPR